MAEQKDSAAPHAVVYQPTPTQAENDLAQMGQLPFVKQYDGSPIDQSSHNPAVPTPPGAPIVTSTTPTTAALPAAPWTVTVHGSGFTSAAKVIFNQNAVATTFTSATQVIATVPAAAAGGAPGSYALEVHDAGGYSNAVQFAVTATALLSESPENPPPLRASRRATATKEQSDG